MSFSTSNLPAAQNLRHNYVVNMLDGAFWGFAMGFASFTTIIPLFVSTLTGSAILIGLIPAIHTMGWQLPQLLTAKRITGITHFKPFVMLATIHERVPFLGLVLVAWMAPNIPAGLALSITFVLLVWQGLGSGFTANAWQNMIGKVIPSDYLATFFGLQSAAMNLLASGGAVVSGLILERLDSPKSFPLCFLIASGMMAFSYLFIGLTREHKWPQKAPGEDPIPLKTTVRKILKSDRNFRNFLIARTLSQFGMMAFAFYIVYAVRHHHMSDAMAGVMTSILFATQVIANPTLGWIADKWSRKGVVEIGAISITASALLAWLSPSLYWFILVFVLAGIANTAFWVVIMAMTLEFGHEDERPTYIGMANTLIAPAAILAPLLGGFLADRVGYAFTFITAAAAGLATATLLHFSVKDQQKLSKSVREAQKP